tara:strand:+ start:354 stop:1364 length:1011 start_codon:yes stop_codon:yes gene_type:complete
VNLIKNKKSQITVFIIIGIILLILIGLVYYILTIQTQSSVDQTVIEEIQFNVEGVSIFVENCMESVTESGLQLLGMQGGKIYLSEEYLKTDYSNILYSYYNNQNKIVSLSEMEEQLNQYIVVTMPKCVDGFVAFEDEGIDVEEISISSDTFIGPKDIVFELNYELLINGQSKLNKFRKSLPVKLQKIHSDSYDLINKIKSDSGWLDITDLSEFDNEVSVIPYSNDEFIISITDAKSINGKDFVYLLAFKFEKNSAPNFDIPQILQLNDNVEFNYKIEALDPEDDSFIFTDNHAMFDITEDGIISFVPKVKGEFNVIITVTDVHDNSNSKEVKFIVQ